MNMYIFFSTIESYWNTQRERADVDGDKWTWTNSRHVRKRFLHGARYRLLRALLSCVYVLMSWRRLITAGVNMSHISDMCRNHFISALIIWGQSALSCVSDTHVIKIRESSALIIMGIASQTTKWSRSRQCCVLCDGSARSFVFYYEFQTFICLS